MALLSKTHRNEDAARRVVGAPGGVRGGRGPGEGERDARGRPARDAL